MIHDDTATPSAVSIGQPTSFPGNFPGRGIKVNFGCFDQNLPGWQNIDNCLRHIVVHRIPGLPFLLHEFGLLTKERYLEHKRGRFKNLKYGDARRRLTFPSNSVKCIYTSHMLEHLYPEDAIAFLRECHRILLPRGLMRILIPDLERAVRNYCANLSDSERRLHALRKLVYVFFPLNGREKYGHRWMYDFSSLACILEETGFRTVRQAGFRQGECPDCEVLDRDPESLFVEATK